MTKASESLFASMSEADLDAKWREHLDAAQDNDDFGGHVGISRYHRQAARAIGDEMQRREQSLRLCSRCNEEKPQRSFRRRNCASLDGGPDVWCRRCEREHWSERVGTVELLDGLL